MTDPLDSFSTPVRLWFRETFGEPTPPQAQGWPPIQRGEHTLILAPTGSGKTLAAFLWAIDDLYRQVDDGTRSAPGTATGDSRRQTAGRKRKAPQDKISGVRLLYISPLKALNNDIERNLRVPLDGIRAAAARLGQELPPLRVAVRTGDTPSHVRNAMWKKPPHILITTPESLYLMLTSPRARHMFRTVQTVIVDEIHTLSGNKRGVHLSLSLERLAHIAQTARSGDLANIANSGDHIQRIGLSATIKPLDEVARFLCGSRPVTIVDAAYRKPLELRVITAVEDFKNLPGESVWPSVIPHVLQDIRQHRHTLIFCNNRRLAERTADRLNAQLAAEESEEIAPGSPEALAPGGTPRDRGIFALGADGPIRAHHGSMSKEARRKMEEDLKAGRLPALVGTSSLELGIDIGSVDLVVQLQSPKSVAQGLQRVGRSGHLVGEASAGHIYATFREDLLEAAAIARGMLDGDVEPTFTPQNPLDVLAQQIVAMVAVEEWSVPELYDLVRQAYAYHDLPLTSFHSVLAMLSGKYADLSLRDLRARIAWDRVNDRLSALPGSRLVAMMNAGTISDTGAYGVYLGDGKTKIGELDEEFVFETRVGDTFLLGSHVWRVVDMDNDRITVDDASGAVPRMPFWNGDYPWRPYPLGVRIGRFRGEVAERIEKNPDDSPALEAWLEREYALDSVSARNLLEHVRRQLDAVGVISSDKTIVVESFQDAVGEARLVIHSPFGGRINGAWALALGSALREHTHTDPEVQSNDDGILFRFPNLSGDAPVAVIRQMTAGEARERILRELGNSALFGAHFRMNAARALLLPKARGQKRTPFWLQRLKAKDLLATVRRYADFPIIAETYRDCLRDVLDLPHLEEVLNRISTGEIQVIPIETAVPSPIASGLLYQFINVYMYEWDAPKAERQLASLSFQQEMLDGLSSPGEQLRNLLKPEAVDEISSQNQHIAAGFQARTAEELALFLQELGDLSTDEIVARTTGDGHAWIKELVKQGRVAEIAIPTARGPETRWVPAELVEEYLAFTFPDSPDSLLLNILRRYFRNSGPITRAAILERYAFPVERLDQALHQLTDSGEIVRGQLSPAPTESEEFCDRRNLEHIRRRTLTLLRKEIQPVPFAAFADFLLHWQHLHPHARLRAGEQNLRSLMEQLLGAALPGMVWERDILPGRIDEYDPSDLDALGASGEWVWAASGQDPPHARVRFISRGEGALFLPSPDEGALSPTARRVYDYLKAEGASFTLDLEKGLIVQPALVQAALLELALAGLVTNDSLETLRVLLSTPRPPGSMPPSISPLQRELAARLQKPRPLTRGRYHDAKRRVAQRLKEEVRLPAREGRWSLLHRFAVMGSPLSDEERQLLLAQVLLARYGIFARECLELEQGNAEWALLYPVFQLMELRDQVRRGYFVTGLSGIQFALPEAVERLRRSGLTQDEAFIVMNATDPANLFTLVKATEALHFARVPSTFLVVRHGQPILVAEESGARITTQPNASMDLIHRALLALVNRPNAPRHIVTEQWNGEPVLSSPAEPFLHSLGFKRTPKGMEYENTLGSYVA